jgi:hypothetical protein
MSEGRGCLKTGLLGCGALVALAVVGLLVMLTMAWVGKDKGGRVDEDATPEPSSGYAAAPFTPDTAALFTTGHPGRVILDLGQGEFHLGRAAPGEGLTVRAEYDTEVHELTYGFDVTPDSTWTAQITFRQSMPALQAVFRKILGGRTDAVIHIELPPESPLELVVRCEQGGAEIELGGLWLRTADFDVRQGGFELSVDEPLRDPVERMRLHSRMGGLQAVWLGNASPRLLEVDCAMGGADLDLRGDWRNDCDARLVVRMGGMGVRVPADMRVIGVGEAAPELRRTDEETPRPELRLTVDQKLGEIEVSK